MTDSTDNSKDPTRAHAIESIHDDLVILMKMYEQTLHQIKENETASRERLLQTKQELIEKIAALQQLNQEFAQNNLIASERIERVALETEHSLQKLAAHSHLDYIKNLTQAASQHIDKVASNAVTKVTKKTRSLLWEKFATAFFAAVLASLVIGLFINDEWPWEMHHNVVESRLLGEAVIRSWSDLSDADQQKILENIRKHKAIEIIKQHPQLQKTNSK